MASTLADKRAGNWASMMVAAKVDLTAALKAWQQVAMMASMMAARTDASWAALMGERMAGYSAASTADWMAPQLAESWDVHSVELKACSKAVYWVLTKVADSGQQTAGEWDS
jgi:galactitol-specific phosphotransferase system IIC component